MPRNYSTGTDQCELELETAAGHHIPNFQDAERIPSGMAEGLRRSHNRDFPEPLVKRRTTLPTNLYNCHGLVFASRRSKVFEPDHVRTILRDDQYRQIVRLNAVLPGDVVIYLVKGVIDHTGVVVEVIQSEIHPKITIVSKWAQATEMIHDLYDCPYAKQADVTYEYWRMELQNDPFNRPGRL